MLKKIIFALIPFLVVTLLSLYILGKNPEMEVWMRVGFSLFFGAVAGLVGWVAAGE